MVDLDLFVIVIQDAWLDSAEVDTKFAAKLKAKAKDEEEEFQDLTSDDVGKIKRIIADILQPGETVWSFLYFVFLKMVLHQNYCKK